MRDQHPERSGTNYLSRRRFLKGGIGVSLGSAGLLSSTDNVRAAPGEQQWVFETRYSIMSSPTVVDGTVFVGSSDDNLYAVDAATGKQEWNFETGSTVKSSPTVVDGAVYVGSMDGNLYAVDAATGDQLWVFETGREVFSSPTVVDGTVFVGNVGFHLYAVDAATGEQQWAFETANAVDSSPTVVDGTVFVGSGTSTYTDESKLYAVDATSGEQQWTFETGTYIRSSPTVVDGTVYVGSDGLYAVDAAIGEQQWAFETDGLALSSPTVVDGTVFVGSYVLHAVDAATGEQQWAFDTGYFQTSSPTVADGTVFVGSADNNLHAVNAATGEQQWFFETGGDVLSSPTVVDGTVFVGSYDGNLYAVDAGVSGPSEGSRVLLGTLGHHNGWRYAGQNIDVQPQTPTEGLNESLLAGGAAVAGMTALGSVAAYRRLSDASELATFTEWPRPGRDAANTAAAPDCRAVQPDADRAWQAGSHETTPPVVADDIVVAGHAEGTVTARDARSGERLWRTSIGGTTKTPTTPTIEFSSVYAACGTILVVLDWQSGATEWRLSLPDEAAGTPIPHEDTLYMACEDGTVLAINAKGGAEQWRASVSAPVSHRPAVADGQVVVSTTEQTVTALDTADGDTNWTAVLQADRLSAPVVADGTVYVADSGGTLHALNADNGDVIWTVKTGIRNLIHVAATAGSVWLASQEGTVIGVATADYEHTSPKRFETTVTGLAIVDTTLYVGGKSNIWGLSTKNSEERWQLPLDKQATGIAPTSEALYVGTESGLSGYQAESGDGEWDETGTEAKPEAKPERTDERLAVSKVTQPDTNEPPSTSDGSAGKGSADKLATDIRPLNELTLLADDSPLEVYRGRHAEEADEVRVLTPSDPTEPVAERFQRAVLGWVNGSTHPNVVTIHDRGMEPRPWVATEPDAEWTTLAEHPDWLGFEQTIGILTDAAEGLRNVALYNAYHHNLSPRHIWAGRQDDEVVGKVDDWGLDRAVREATSETVITPYTAPEQVSDAYGQPDEATDIYGLGAVAYYVLTGTEPVEAEREAILAGNITPPSEVSEVPAGLDKVLLRALSTDPADRYDSMYTFGLALDNAL